MFNLGELDSAIGLEEMDVVPGVADDAIGRMGVEVVEVVVVVGELLDAVTAGVALVAFAAEDGVGVGGREATEAEDAVVEEEEEEEEEKPGVIAAEGTTVGDFGINVVSDFGRDDGRGDAALTAMFENPGVNPVNDWKKKKV